ncbi:toxin-antitoxin system, antitoxin component, Xre family protein [Pseudanabaena mucicola]|uniref:Toxin-antitoxin system, antitoxin component, Xre family protein n=1 Tax=Pseudanabaena mucicola FACHB-723 TaxID=2692860 RepID=A0ABR7ZYS7_9CYAN|nr:toxin-antitoxin system, antitoxin component, Xre family protein [Pseudanabaena mucicola]MBD2189126.1 toxin-antitoxin system, antitoxin component, Xre family protein [Pseudanabaena mucicola FACHB-723]
MQANTIQSDAKSEQRILEKIRKLPFDKIVELENFIDLLYQRPNSSQALVTTSTKLSEASFAKIWDNPEDSAYDNL